MVDAEQLRKFVAPEFVEGRGARHLAGQYASNLGMRHALFVTDRGVQSAGWADQIADLLQDCGVRVTVFTDTTPNPKDYEVMAGAQRYLDSGCNGIVVVGGGSPIDCAKGIAIVVSSGGHIRDYEGVDRVPSACPPLLCIPTTAGTAADVSQFAIVTDSVRKSKMAIVSKAVVPDVSLIDADTTLTADPGLTANTGMDTLCHAIEALVSNASSGITDLHALEAARLIAAHLLDAVRAGADSQARLPVMRACLHAGLAFSNASLGAVHAMAHALGGQLDLPHGACNAILLPHVVAYNFAYATEPFRRLAAAFGLPLDGGDDAVRDRLVDKLKSLQKELCIAPGLAALGVSSDRIPMLAKTAMCDACIVTNPRRPTLSDLEQVYERAL